MEISRKLDYALRMLCAVSRSDGGGIVSVRQVAEAHGIPYSFARTIQHEMVKAGLLATMRGPRGGMTLAVDAASVTLLDIIEAIEGPLRMGNVEGAPPNGDVRDMSELDLVLSGMDRLVHAYLGSVTLRQLAVERKVPVICGSYRFEPVEATRLVPSAEG